MLDMILPPNESSRLEALRRYQIIDTPSEQTFDEITFLAAHVCITPFSVIAFVDGDRVWYKSKVGMTMSGVPRAGSFSGQAITQSDIFMLEDATADERFKASPSVIAYSYIRFYAGASLVTPDGHALGAVAVIDRSPRKLRPEQEEALRTLSRQVITQLELRRNLIQMEKLLAERTQAEQTLREGEQKFRGLIESAPDAIVIVNIEGKIDLVNVRAEKMLGYTRTELIGMGVDNLLPDSLREMHTAHRQSYVATPRVRSMGVDLKITGRRRDGGDFPIEVSLSPMTTVNGMLIVSFIREARGDRSSGG